MKNRIIYLFRKQFTKGSKRLYFWLTIFSLIPILFISLIIYISGVIDPSLNPLAGGNYDFMLVFFSQLLAALDPGFFLEYGIVDGTADSPGASTAWDGGILFLVCSLLATFSGLMVVATLIGIVSSSMENVMLSLRKGKTIVVEKNHIVILGWNDQIFSIIRELQLANENMKKTCIVVMADYDTEMMQDEVSNRVSLNNLDMVYRSGNVLDIDDLKKLSIKDARSIIILTGLKDRDSQALKISLAIDKLTPGDWEFKPNFSVVVAMEKEENIQLLNDISKNTITTFNTHLLQSRIIAQCCRQAGLSVIYNDLLDFEGEEIYFFKIDAKKRSKYNIFINKQFQDVSLALNNATLIGIATDNKCIIQPNNDYLIQDGDELILIQNDDDNPELTKDVLFYEDSLNISKKQSELNMNILIINWHEDTPLILRDLNAYLSSGSNIDIILSDSALSEVDSDIKDKLNVIRDFISANDLSQEFFRKLNLAQYDSIVLLSDNIIPDINISNISDAKSMITLLQIRLVLKELGRSDIPVVSQIQNPQNRDLMENEESYDIIVSNKLIGNYTCQLAENPRLKQVFDEILLPEGSELYMRDIEDYVKTKNKINFYTVVKAGAKQNELVLGYKIRSEDKSKNHGIYLNPKKSEEIEFFEGDQVIILAENEKNS